MNKAHKITLLGTGLIGRFYTMTLHGMRGRDRVHCIYSRDSEKAAAFAEEFDIPKSTSNLKEAITDLETDIVVIGLPNDMHKDLVKMCADASKAILCTKPLGRTGKEAKEMLDIVDKAGIFAGYLEDLAYTPKTLKAIDSVKHGTLGKILWVRSRETHPGPHSDWFWDLKRAGGGAIVDLGCHCIEIIRNFIGKDIKPVEVMCTADTLVHPIDAEDSGIALIRFENKAIGQFEVSWTFRGGMDLRDEIAGTEGTIWLNHFLRTGYEMFTSGGEKGYVAEKAESETGWLFPVGDEVNELGYNHMFTDMFNAMDEGVEPMETFYDGYVVNAIIDACYRSAQSKQWETVQLEDWRGLEVTEEDIQHQDIDKNHVLMKKEVMPDGKIKLIMKNKKSGEIIQKFEDE